MRKNPSYGRTQEAHGSATKCGHTQTVVGDHLLLGVCCSRMAGGRQEGFEITNQSKNWKRKKTTMKIIYKWKWLRWGWDREDVNLPTARLTKKRKKCLSCNLQWRNQARHNVDEERYTDDCHWLKVTLLALKIAARTAATDLRQEMSVATSYFHVDLRSANRAVPAHVWEFSNYDG